MPRLWIAIFAIATAVLGLLPTAAQATVSQSQITSWVSQSTDPQGHPTTVANGAYLLSLDNPPTPTTLDVKGTAPGSSPGDPVDITCFFGTGGSVKLRSNLPVGAGGAFDTGAIPLRPIAGHACRLRAVPAGAEATSDVAGFAGPQVAVSEAALPLSSISGGPNNAAAYNYYVNDVTFSGWAAWKAVGANGCGPYVAPIDPTFNVGNFAIDCAGSLLGDDLGAWGGRSEVQIDGHNAYDPASAQALIARTGGQDNGSQDLPGFPTLTASVRWDPSTGLVSTQSQESWAACRGSDPYRPTVIPRDCPAFADTGVRLERAITTSNGGRIVTMTDTWSSTDGRSHTVDLLYDDYVGLSASSAARGYQFPGQSTFTGHVAGDPLPGPAAGPGSILVHTNLGAADGNQAEAFGSITYSTAPSGFHFAPAPAPAPPSNEFEERVVASVPAGGSASLSYIYSVGYSLSDVTSLAMTAQDRFQAPAVTVSSPASGATVSTPAVTLTGTAVAGSGIKSLVVGGQSVPVGPGGAWSAQIPLSPGVNTITALATDGAGVNTQAVVTVVYQPPALPPPTPTATCKVPRIQGMKLKAAKKALRRAHCRVGRIKYVKSRTIAKGRVTSTKPRAGRHLPPDSKIELLVSRGP